MADWSKPDLASPETDYTDEIKARDEDLAKQFDNTTSTNLPDGTIRWNSVNKFWEKLVAGVWGALCDVYNIVVSRAQQADNADTLDGLDSSQFLRSDADDMFTGSLTYDAGSGVPLKFDNELNYGKWIAVNDGSGNFTIKINWDGSSNYIFDGGGAVRIEMDADWADGQVAIDVAPVGSAGTAISSYKRLLVKTDGTFTWDGNKVWHAGNDGPGSGLEADLLDGAHATATPTPGAIPIADSTGKLATGWIPDTIPTGTRMLFGSVPPAGWVLVTDFHDRVLRIVNDAALVGLTGGDWAITGMVSAGGHTHTITINAAGAHQHETPLVLWDYVLAAGAGIDASIAPFGTGTSASSYLSVTNTTTVTTATVPRLLTSSSGSHTHTATETTEGSHAHTFDGTWRPAYLNIVMAEKA